MKCFSTSIVLLLLFLIDRTILEPLCDETISIIRGLDLSLFWEHLQTPPIIKIRKVSVAINNSKLNFIPKTVNKVDESFIVQNLIYNLKHITTRLTCGRV